MSTLWVTSVLLNLLAAYNIPVVLGCVVVPLHAWVVSKVKA